MADPAIIPATYEDLMNVPKEVVAEILYGQLVTHPRPAPRHSFTCPALFGELVGPFQKGKDGPGGWWLFDEPEIHLGDHVLVPDMAGWRRENMAALPETAFFPTAPDWVCEVLSPSTVKYDRLEKRDIYAKFGVKHLWFVDPIAKTLEAFELLDKNWLLLKTLANDDGVSVAPFADITFALNNLWAD